MILTNEEQIVVQEGLEASSLLANGSFQSTIQALKVECFASFTETRPEDSASRESTYNLYQGLKAIEATLRARVQAMEELQRRFDQNDDESDDDVLINDNELGD